MKKFVSLLSLFFAFHRVAAVPNFDPFANATATGGTDYSVGSNLVGQNSSGLFGAWYLRGDSNAGAQPTIATGSLAYSGLPPSSGNSVSFSGSTGKSACIDINLPTGHTNIVYYSFILKITDLSVVSTIASNNPFAAFLDDPSLTFTANTIGRLGSRIVTKKVGAGYVLGVSKSATPTDFVYESDAAAHSVNDVLFVVASHERVPGTGGHTNVNMWINPASSSFGLSTPPSPTLIATSGNSALNNGARAFGILCQFPGAPTGVIDDVRVSTNWVHITGGDPAIVQNPANQAAPEGGNATFSVQARGTATLAYRWNKDGNNLTDGGNISGANTATLTISTISAADVGSYSVFVTNGVGNFVQSASATLSLADPAISTQPQSRTNNFGTTATFQTVASGTAPFTYKWSKDGNNLTDGGNIIGANTATLTLTGVSYPDSGSYSVTVSNTLASATSQPAVLTVRDPFISTQPVSVAAVAGTNVSFSVVAQGSGPFVYQWRKNGNSIFDLGNYSGTSTATMTVSGISSTDEGGYSVSVVGAYSTTTSSDAFLTVVNPVSIMAQPTPRAVLAGSKTTMAVGVSGTSPIFYQWLRNNVGIPGATSFAYTVTNAQAADAGSYSVTVSNSLNTVTSATAALTITPSLYIATTNISVLRVGDGAQSLSANGNSMFMDQFAGNGTYLSTLNLPESGTNAIITQGPNTVPSPSSVTGTTLSRSVDQRFLVVAGYNTSVGYGAGLNASTSASVPRGIALIDSAGQYNLAVASTNSAFSGTFFRSAVTDGTNNYWGSGRTPGTYYFGFDNAAGLIQNTFANIRSMALFNGSIYCVSAVSGNSGVMKLDGGMPKPGGNTNGTIFFSTSTGSSDLEVSPNGNLIYLADDRAAGNGGGVQRWEFNGSTWSLAYTLTNGVPLGTRYVTADFSGSSPVVYAATKEAGDDNNRIVVITDTGVDATGTTVAYAGANQNFRGLRFGPINTTVTAPILSVSRNGSNIVLSWQGAFTLQSATNVSGTYTNVGGATNPQTNSIGASAQQFFRLQN